MLLLSQTFHNVISATMNVTKLTEIQTQTSDFSFRTANHCTTFVSKLILAVWFIPCYWIPKLLHTLVWINPNWLLLMMAVTLHSFSRNFFQGCNYRLLNPSVGLRMFVEQRKQELSALSAHQTWNWPCRVNMVGSNFNPIESVLPYNPNIQIWVPQDTMNHNLYAIQ